MKIPKDFAKNRNIGWQTLWSKLPAFVRRVITIPDSLRQSLLKKIHSVSQERKNINLPQELGDTNKDSKNTDFVGFGSETPVNGVNEELIQRLVQSGKQEPTRTKIPDGNDQAPSGIAIEDFIKEVQNSKKPPPDDLEKKRINKVLAPLLEKNKPKS